MLKKTDLKFCLRNLFQDTVTFSLNVHFFVATVGFTQAKAIVFRLFESVPREQLILLCFVDFASAMF